METYIRRRPYGRCHRNSGIRFPGVSVPSKSSTSASWRSFPTPTQTCGYIIHVCACVYVYVYVYVYIYIYIYIYYMRKWKAVMLAVPLGSVFNWLACTLIYACPLWKCPKILIMISIVTGRNPCVQRLLLKANEIREVGRVRDSVLYYTIQSILVTSQRYCSVRFPVSIQ
jgi:hypothetical protein